MPGLGFQSCQREGRSRFRDDKPKPDREKVALSEEEAERKDFAVQSSRWFNQARH
jgi:hypothetical protein